MPATASLLATSFAWLKATQSSTFAQQVAFFAQKPNEKIYGYWKHEVRLLKYPDERPQP
jgi:hypothetical protein